LTETKRYGTMILLREKETPFRTKEFKGRLDITK